MAEPKSGVAFELAVNLIKADGTGFQADPTIVAGDVKVSTNGGALTANIETLPSVFAVGESALKVNLSASEMTATKYATIKFKDVAGGQWQEKTTHILMPAQNTDGLDVKIDAIKAKTDLQPTGIKKNAARNNYPIVMRDANDNALTGLTVTATRAIDALGFLASSNTVSEIGNGAYRHSWSASDLNGDTIIFRFTAPGAVDLFVTVVTNK